MPLLKNYQCFKSFTHKPTSSSSSIKTDSSLVINKQVKHHDDTKVRIKPKSERKFKSLSLCVASSNQAGNVFNCAPLAKPESFSDIYLSAYETRSQVGENLKVSPHAYGNIYEKLMQENCSIESETNCNKNVSINEDVYYDDSINLKNPIFNLQSNDKRSIQLNDKYSNFEVSVIFLALLSITLNVHNVLFIKIKKNGVKSSVVWWPYNQEIECSSSNFIGNNSKSMKVLFICL